MLSSIHPLGERGRNNRWGWTAGAFAVGAMAAGATVGAGLGAVGSLLGLDRLPVLAIVALVAGAAALLDARRIEPLGPRRQVNERWIGAYRGWVYGVSFGAQLGAGGATYIVTWLVYAAATAAALTGSIAGGAVVGLVFGAMRTVPVLAARWIDRPSRLGVFHKRMATLGPQVRTATILLGVIAALSAVGGIVA